MPYANWKQSPFYENVLLRSVTYYIIMGSIAWMLREYTPTAWGVLGGEEVSALIGAGTMSKGQAAAEAALRASQPAALPAIVAMSWCHASQIREWLPWVDVTESPPRSEGTTKLKFHSEANEKHRNHGGFVETLGF